MSLGIAFKGPEGIVLAADSRVTLMAQMLQAGQPAPLMLPATFDNATKLLKVRGQDYVAAVTYGLGAIGVSEPRTAHSFLPEFEAELEAAGAPRLSVEDFARRLSAFFLRQFAERMPAHTGDPMTFLVAGYDEGAPYGRVFEIALPVRPDPVEQNPGQAFGPTLGGQTFFAVRLLQGFDQSVPSLVKERLQLSEEDAAAVLQVLRERLGMPVPYQFLPLQDCVDLAIFIIRATISMQRWMVDVRGVGGAIDVATITNTAGFVPIQQKAIHGELQSGGQA